MPPQRFVFGPFLLDLDDERLWRDDRAVPLGSKAFAVLHCLVTRAGQLTTKALLLETVWPEIAVNDAVLTVAIGALRRALGDQARSPRFIETVHGRGYRFIAPVVPDENSLHVPGNDALMPPLPSRPSPRPEIFVGREREYARMQQWFTTARQGERQVGFLSGEPGIGKTALVATFVAHVVTTEPIWSGHGQCIDHYGAGEAYLPVLEALTRLCRGPGGDQLITLLRHYAPSWLGQMPAVLPAEEREAFGHARSRATQPRMLRELAEAFEVMTEARPLILVLEDLHWSDPSTLALLAYLARRYDPARLLILGTYRPSDVLTRTHPLRHMVAELQHHQQCEDLSLDPLPATAIATYVQERFLSKTFPEALVAFLQQRSHGNPLFLIATVDELLHRGLLQEEATALVLRNEVADRGELVPENLSTLITQYVEQLSAEELAILEAASVAGMTFSVAAVAVGVDLAPATIEARCTTWSRQGQFVQAHGTERWPDGTVAACYSFRHALYYDVVLERISAGQRIQLHHRIATRKAMAYANQTQDIAAELAVHFEYAQELQQAVFYRRQAAETALHRSAYKEALSHLTRGLSLVKAMTATPERHRDELSFELMVGSALSAMQGFGSPAAEHAYTQARLLASQLGETLQLFTALGGLWRVYLSRGRLQTAKRLGDESYALAQQANDADLLVESHYMLSVTLFYLGNFSTAHAHAKQGLAIYHPQRHHTLALRYGGTDPGVACHCYAAQALCLLGYPDTAIQHNHQALQLARELGYPLSMAYALNQSLVFHQLRREGDEVRKRADEVMAFCLAQGFPQMLAMGTILKGWSLIELGQVEAGIVQMRHGLSMNPEGIALGSSPVMAQLAEAHGATEQPDKGLALLAEAFQRADGSAERWYEAELYRVKGELLFQCSSDYVDEAERHLCQALHSARHQHAKSWELRAATSLARLRQSQGKRQNAYDLLASVYDWFTEGVDTADLREAKVLLDALRE